MANKTSKGQENYYARYKSGNVHAKNRKIKLERALKRQPNNEQIKLALKDIRYRRKTPGANGWLASQIAVAKILKEFGNEVNRNIFNSNGRVASDALQSLTTINAGYEMPKDMKESISNKAMFSLKARLKSAGEYLHANSKSLSV